MGEKVPRKREQEATEQQRLRELYAEIYDAGMFVKEFRFSEETWGAAVGTQEELVVALGLKSVEELSADTIDKLPLFIPFAMPGTGATRPEAVESAFTAMREHLAHEAQVVSGEAIDGSVYGEFTIGEVKVTAYLPNRAPDNWTVVIEQPDEQPIIRTLPMDYAPVFGPDAADVAALNTFVEELIQQYGLE